MIKFCTECGTVLSSETKFCTNCGAAVPDPEDSSPWKETEAYISSHRAGESSNIIYSPAFGKEEAELPPPQGSKYEVIGTGGFVGILLLLGIPVLGLILCIIWACGGCRKISKTYLARAFLILHVLGLTICLLVGFATRSLIGTLIPQLEAESGIPISQIIKNIQPFEETYESPSAEESAAGEAAVEEENGEANPESGDEREIPGAAELLALLPLLSGGEMLQELQNMDPQLLSELLESQALEGVDLNTLAQLLTEEARNESTAENIAEAGRNEGSGWPEALREYPGGSSRELEGATQISGSSREEMLSWIEALKNDGFYYQDFYNSGKTEQELLEENEWWAYNGELFLHISYKDEIVTVEYDREMPNIPH
ncbi:MAG: zinc ribbon domain-containing protein [Bacillota bacterium]|nr:zinc ribbon domain-containing protein [Bacillota bacterium]